MSAPTHQPTPAPDATEPDRPRADHAESGVQRRRFLGYLVAGPTLAVAVRLGADALAPSSAAAAVPTPDGPAEAFDLNDLLTAAAMPTANLVTLTVAPDGTVHFALPRSENGQGILTSTAMIIAEELDVKLSKVKVTLADARPELVWNQLTGGSNTTISTYTPIRTAAAIARGALLEAAALQLGTVPVSALRTRSGKVVAPDGRTLSYASLARSAATDRTRAMEGDLKAVSDFTVVGRPTGRLDARDAVTGRKRFAMDLKVKGAKPTMVCRPPQLNGTPKRILNRDKVLRMDGVTHVVQVSTGVAVRARTFGQCIDAIRALRVEWNPGPLDGLGDQDILAEVRAAEIPLAVPAVPGLATTVEGDFTFWFASNSALETNCAIADVRADRAEIWGPLKSPISAQEEIGKRLGLAPTSVKVHVTQGGGSFGRKLFYDAALEAAEISKAIGKPVKLMWHRADDARQGRVHPMATARVRATVLADQVLTYEHRHTSVKTDFGHGLGELITALSAQLPVGDLGFSETVFTLTQGMHYNFGATTILLNETESRFNTGSMRNIYSPNVAVARELMVDQLAKQMGKDPLDFRLEFLREEGAKAVLRKVATAGEWGRRMGTHRAQGLGVHNEYHGHSACLVEIDNRPTTVQRKVRQAVTGPRVTKVVFAVDVGLPINPTGLKAQMMGGIMDAIALVLTSSMHLQDGYFAEASWDNYAYTRQWNVPPEVQIFVMPPSSDNPGGAGEFGVPAAAAAIATAYARAIGRVPKEFPINHGKPLFFPVKPTVPPIPPSPTNGRSQTF